MMEKSHLMARPLFGLGLLLLLGALVSLLIWVQLARMQAARAWVNHTYSVIVHIDRVFENLATAESDQRGFLVTGNRDFLKDYQNNVDLFPGPEVARDLEQLRVLTRDNKIQADRLLELEDLIKDKVDFMRLVIRMVDERSLAEAQLYSRNGQGRVLMDMVRAKLEEMKSSEYLLLEERSRNSDRINKLNIMVAAIMLLLLMMVVSFAFLAIQREMGRRQSVEDRLRAVSAFQQAVLDSTLFMIIAVDTYGTIQMFNHAAENALGYEASEMIGRTTPACFHDHDEMISYAADLSTELGYLVKPGFDVFTTKPNLLGFDEREWTYVRKDGTRFPVSLCITALRDEQGNISGYMGTAQDISERKQIERMKNEFISTVSHELRTPLTSIRGSLGLIIGSIGGDIPDKVRNLVEIAYKNSERLTRLINDILDIEKIESGNIAFEKRPVVIDSILQQALDENQGFAEKYNVRLHFTSETQGSKVMGDPDRLLQVLANLLSNAIKYAPSESVVTLASHKTDKGVSLTVHDRGTGIPDDFKSKIFSKFAQADSSDTRQKGGTGLGLSISKAIVEAMGGEIGFSSEPGHTIFRVDLPEMQDHPLFPAIDGDKKTVLVCEDDADIAALLCMILKRENFDCVIATTAQEAKRHLSEREFAGMTLDLALPDQDGLDLIRELRAHDKTLHLPIVVISAHAEDGRRRLNGDAIGILDWLSKPIDLERLQRVLQIILRGEKLPSVLHIEDDEDISQMIAMALQGAAEITFAPTLSSARTQLSLHVFDLALLDIRLPDGDGLDLLPELSARHVPVIILSANQTSEEIQRKVISSMVKSRIPEDKIVQTIKNFLEKGLIG